MLALRMLAVMVADLPVSLDIRSTRMLASELVSEVRASGVRVVCIADLPPSAPSKTRYLVRRLRTAIPDLKIVVGRWAPPEFVDDTLAPLRDSQLLARSTHAQAAPLRETARLPSVAPLFRQSPPAPENSLGDIST